MKAKNRKGEDPLVSFPTLALKNYIFDFICLQINAR